MTVLPLGPGSRDDALRHAVELLKEAGEDVVVTAHGGEPVAVLVDPEKFHWLQEYVDIVGTPGEADAIDEGITDLNAGLEVDGAEVLARLRKEHAGEGR